MGTGSNLMNGVVGLQRAWLHRSLKFFEKMVNTWEGTLSKIAVIFPNNFELPQFRVFALQMLRIGGLLMIGCPRLTLPDQMKLPCLLFMPLIFAWTALSGFQSIETLLFA